MAEVLMSQMGFDMQEGTLVRWLKKPGERVERNEPIAEIETDKAVLQIEAFEGGVLAKILVEEGKTVPVGTPIAILNGGAAGDEQAAGTPSPGDGAAEAADAAARRAVAAAQVPPAAAPAQGVAVEPIAEGSDQGGAAAASSAETQSQRIKASPLARRLARERGLDLRSIRGTGPGGRIVKADVEAASAAAAEAPRPAAAPAPAPVPATEAGAPGPVLPPPATELAGRRVPLTRMRQVIATRMRESKLEAPHFYVSMSVDMGAALAFRKQFNETVGEEERASVNDLIVKACGLALMAVPSVNASFQGDAIQYHDSADIAIAVALEGGLITPVVRACHIKPLNEIAVEARQLAQAAREGRLRPDQYQGGTFTVSNLGMYGVDDFIAIINPPQAAILAVGAIQETPVVREGTVTVRPMMRITLSADHRATDGADAARFLQEVKGVLEQPLRLLMPPRTRKEG